MEIQGVTVSDSTLKKLKMLDTLPKLRTATSLIQQEDNTVSKEYKSGAKFHGEVTDHKKSGHGTFIWPNGAKYIGDYRDNARCGKGKYQKHFRGV